MKRPLLYALLGLGAYLITLLASFPAVLAYRWAGPWLDKSPITLAAVEGRVWEGRAGMLSYQKRPLGRVSWSLSPSALLLGQLSLSWKLDLEEGTVQGEASLARDGELVLHELKGRLPAAQLTALYPIPMVSIDGLVALRLDEVLIQGGQLLRARGQLGWHQAAITAPQALGLGDLLLTLDERKGEGGIRGLLQDQGGPLQAEGEVLLEPNGRYHINGRLAAREGRQSALARALAMLGRADAGGWVNLKFTGKL